MKFDIGQDVAMVSAPMSSQASKASENDISLH